MLTAYKGQRASQRCHSRGPSAAVRQLAIELVPEGCRVYALDAGFGHTRRTTPCLVRGLFVAELFSKGTGGKSGLFAEQLCHVRELDESARDRDFFNRLIRCDEELAHSFDLDAMNLVKNAAPRAATETPLQGAARKRHLSDRILNRERLID